MPQVAPITLKDSDNANVVFNPVSLVSSTALFADQTATRTADWPKLSANPTPPTKSAGKGSMKTTFTVPVPVVDQSGCCVDKDAPSVISFNVSTGLPINTEKAKAEDALALFRSWVNSTTFKDLYLGSGWY